jgi:tetratricopeptide (TPR) repeat protein
VSGGRFSNLEYEGADKRGKDSLPSPADDQLVNAIKDAAYYVNRAVEQELAGDLEKALRSYSAALGENPLLLDAWVGQLLMLLELEEYREVELWANKAMEKFPDNPRLLAVKSVSLHRMGRRREGRDMHDAAVAGKGEIELVWFCRGEIMLAENRAAGEDCFKHAERLSERKPLTRLRIAAICYRYGKYQMALSMLQDISTQMAKSARLWYLMGRTQDGLGLRGQALTSYRQAAELSPFNAVYGRAARGEDPASAGWLTGLFRRLRGR